MKLFNRGTVLLALGALIFPFFAPAYEYYPEFQSLTETEESLYETPRRFGSEYASDVLAYLRPFDWEYRWLTQKRAFDLSLGSVSSAHFLQETRLKLHAPVNEHLEFRFLFLQERGFERDATHQVVEVIYWPTPKLGLSFYGEPNLYKRDNDTGLSLTYRPIPTHEIRLFHTFVDVMRLKHNDQMNRFIEPHLPYSYGLVGRLWTDPESGKQDFFEYAVRHDTYTLWRFDDAQYDYEYWKVMGYLYGSKALDDRLRLDFRLQFDRKFESRTPISPSSTQVAGHLKTDRYLSLARLEIGHLGPYDQWKLTPGIQLTRRDWLGSDGTASYVDFLPHLLWDIPGFGSGDKQDIWHFSYFLTWHRVLGDIWLTDPQGSDTLIEHRLNIGYEFNFGPRTKLILIATGDLDKFFTGQSWDGGSGQFRMDF